MITHERLLSVLHYDPILGIWTWISMLSDRTPSGTVAGCICKTNGYRYVTIDYVKYKSADLAFFYMKGKWPFAILDHRDTDKSNDKWENLRPASPSQNGANTNTRASSTTGIKGVRLYRNGKFSAQIKVNGKSIHLGYFVSKDVAAARYRLAAEQYFGEFAR
jgi:hypothetical protein